MAACRRVSGLVATSILACLLGPIAQAGQSLALTIKNADGQPLPGVVVYLPGVRAPGVQAPTVIDQRAEAFVPAVAVVQTGTEVQFTNSDNTSHHVYSFSKPNAFALPLYKGDARLTTRLQHPGLVVLGCNIHDSMLGYILVVDSTRAGVTSSSGVVTFDNVPAGRHEVRAWTPGLDRANPPAIGFAEVGTAAPAAVALQMNAGPAAGKRGSSLVKNDY